MVTSVNWYSRESKKESAPKALAIGCGDDLTVKQPNKPVYRALGNPTRGGVTESKVTVEVDLAVQSIGN